MTRGGTTREAQLAKLAMRLPLPISELASGGRRPDEHFFWHKPKVQAFGERLVLTAGLAVAALYVSARRERPDTFPREEVLETILTSILRDGAYVRGGACSVLQRAELITAPPFDTIIRDHRPATVFITSQHDRLSNRLRAELTHPIEMQLTTLLRSLHFLTEFSFEERPSVALFRDCQVDMRPFLSWDGHVLRLFYRHVPGDKVVVFTDFQTGKVQTVESTMGQIGNVLTQVMELLGDDGGARPAIPGPDTTRLSLMPMLAGTSPYGCLNVLASALWECADPNTKKDLWLREVYGDDEQYLNGILATGSKVLGTNLIIRHCLERDPVAVLEEFLERSGIAPLVASVAGAEAEAQQVLGKIDAQARRYHEFLLPFYCSDPAALSAYLNDYRGRVAAIEVAKLVGLPVIERILEPGIDSYQHRASAFLKFLRADRRRMTAAINEGVYACCKSAEHILRFLCVFYEALPHYGGDYEGGLSPQGQQDALDLRKRLSRQTFGQILPRFRNLKTGFGPDVQKKLSSFLGRDELWPDSRFSLEILGEPEAAGRPLRSRPQVKSTRALGALGRLKHWRDAYSHYEEDPSKDPWQSYKDRVFKDEGKKVEGTNAEIGQSLVRDFQRFLYWLLEPTRPPEESGSSSGETLHPWRIYPAVVSLNLVAVTRTGFSSLKYVLREIGEPARPVTLCTTQKIIGDRSLLHYYYGLPKPQNVGPDLWIEPVLIRTDYLTGEVEQEA